MAHKGKLYRRSQRAIDLSIQNPMAINPPERLILTNTVFVGDASEGWVNGIQSLPCQRSPGEGWCNWIFEAPPGADPDSAIEVKAEIEEDSNGYPQLYVRARTFLTDPGAWSALRFVPQTPLFVQNNTLGTGMAGTPPYQFGAIVHFKAVEWSEENI